MNPKDKGPVSLLDMGFRLFRTKRYVYVEPYGVRLPVHPNAQIPENFLYGKPHSMFIPGGTFHEPGEHAGVMVPRPNQMLESVQLDAKYFTGEVHTEYGWQKLGRIRAKLQHNRLHHPIR